MGQLYVDTIEPQSGTALTVGESGQNTVLAGNDLRANVVQDAGGNAIFTSNGSGTLSGVNSAFGSARVLLQTTALTNVATCEYTSISNTYNHYIFTFYGYQPATNNTALNVQFSTNGGSSYGISTTDTVYQTAHDNANSYTDFQYLSSEDHASDTGFIQLGHTVGSDPKECGVYEFHLFDPASTNFTYWICKAQVYTYHDFSAFWGLSGQIQSTTAIDAIQFKSSSGNIDLGTFKVWGLL